MNITRKQNNSYRPLTISSRKRKVKRVLIRVLVFVVLPALIIGGILFYIWLSGKQVPLSQEPLPEPKKTVPVEHKPPTVPENAQLGAYVSQISTPVKPGENASLTLSTLPDASCRIEITYENKVKASDSGLAPKVSDDYGQIVWSWTVEPGAPKGKWPVEINCTRAKKSSYVKSELEIKP